MAVKKRKEIESMVKIQIPAGKANPAPPIGTALGPRGINIAEFCKQFNEKTKANEAGQPLPTVISIYKDRSFDFIIKTPPASFLLKQAAKLEKGSKTPGREVSGSVTMAQCRQIAEQKLPDLNTNDIEAGAKIIAGSARAMGLEVAE